LEGGPLEIGCPVGVLLLLAGPLGDPPLIGEGPEIPLLEAGPLEEEPEGPAAEEGVSTPS